MTRQITEQFVTFRFAIDERLPGDEAAYDEFCELWKRASALVDERQRAHPLRLFTVEEGNFSYEVERWEFCEPEPYLEDQAGRLTWPMAFYNTKGFEPDVLTALRDLCTSALQEVAQGVPVRFVTATANTTYRETETTHIEGL